MFVFFYSCLSVPVDAVLPLTNHWRRPSQWPDSYVSVFFEISMFQGCLYSRPVARATLACICCILTSLSIFFFDGQGRASPTIRDFLLVDFLLSRRSLNFAHVTILAHLSSMLCRLRISLNFSWSGSFDSRTWLIRDLSLARPVSTLLICPT